MSWFDDTKSKSFSFGEDLEERWNKSEPGNGKTRSDSKYDTHRADTDEHKEIIIQELLRLWKQAPDLRLGQLICNAIMDGPHQKDMWGEGMDDFLHKELFNMEDKDFIKFITLFLAPINMEGALR